MTESSNPSDPRTTAISPSRKRPRSRILELNKGTNDRGPIEAFALSVLHGGAD